MLLLLASEAIAIVSVALGLGEELPGMIASTVAVVLTTLAAWIAIGIALRRAHPISERPDVQLAPTFE